MNIRVMTEQIEKQILSPYAKLSTETDGRLVNEKECDFRTCFQRDRDRIIHCKSFRRLKHKTQVYVAPEGDHYRTRLTHTLEVSQISRNIARGLRLNEDLVEAISLGHDLGHSPFGHDGEKILNEICIHGFKHNEQSLRVVDIIEKNNAGLNLTVEVRDGILNHSGDTQPQTLEGKIVRIADRIAYINHDIDDSIRAKVLSYDDLPHECLKVLGQTHAQRIGTMCQSVVFESYNKPDITISEEILEAMNELRKFMFENVYGDLKNTKKENIKAANILKLLYEYYLINYEEMPPEFIQLIPKYDVPKIVCDYISGMSDTFALEIFNRIFIPKPWR